MEEFYSGPQSRLVASEISGPDSKKLGSHQAVLLVKCLFNGLDSIQLANLVFRIVIKSYYMPRTEVLSRPHVGRIWMNRRLQRKQRRNILISFFTAIEF